MKNKTTIIFFVLGALIIMEEVHRTAFTGGNMFYSKFENIVLKEYKESLKSDSSINNVIKVFTENYSTVNKDFNRDEDADMLLFQYGVYDWGDGKNLEIDFVRQLLRNDNIIQIHITIKIPYTEKLSNIDSYEEWYNSSTSDISIDSWRNKIQSMPIFETIDSMKYEIEIWKENAE